MYIPVYMRKEDIGTAHARQPGCSSVDVPLKDNTQVGELYFFCKISLFLVLRKEVQLAIKHINEPERTRARFLHHDSIHIVSHFSLRSRGRQRKC